MSLAGIGSFTDAVSGASRTDALRSVLSPALGRSRNDSGLSSSLQQDRYKTMLKIERQTTLVKKPALIRVAAVLLVAGLAAIASCKDDAETVGGCGNCERILVKCEGVPSSVCVRNIDEAIPQNCIPEQSFDCAPGGGGSGGAGG